MTAEDWPAVESIYVSGIATGDATFETEPPSWEEFDAGRLQDHRIVATEDNEVVGWAAISPTSTRQARIRRSVVAAALGSRRSHTLARAPSPPPDDASG